MGLGKWFRDAGLTFYFWFNLKKNSKKIAQVDSGPAIRWLKP